jgi:hypothetical protein
MANTEQQLHRAVAVGLPMVVAFIAGLLVQPVRSFIAFASRGGEHEVQCIRGGGAYYAFCKGTVLARTVGYPDRLGGVNAVMCGVPPLAQPQYHFFPSFLSQPCLASAYSIDFSDGKTRTRVDVRDGQVAGIFVGPLHALDL